MTDAATTPHMIPVKSTNVESIGHDQASNTLHIRFKDGAHYSYEGVSAAIHRELLAADSIGAFVHGQIKGKFKHRKH